VGISPRVAPRRISAAWERYVVVSSRGYSLERRASVGERRAHLQVMVACLLYLVLSGVDPADADLDGMATMQGPASTLIMPFDTTVNHASFQIVTYVGVEFPAVEVTHWSYWAEDGRHLTDVFVCMTDRDTKVMDPRRVQGETQHSFPPRNVGMGEPVDLTGERGIVIVTAFEPVFGNLPISCGTVSTDGVLPKRLLGGWVIANTATNAAFGGDAFGMTPNSLPDAAVFLEAGIRVSVLNPESLGDSAVIFLTSETSAGVFGSSELGPIQRARADGPRVCCSVAFTDDLEMTVSLPDVCFDAAAFRPISDRQAGNSEIPIIPPTESIAAPGTLRVGACQVADEEGGTVPLGTSFEQFLFVIHGQSLGPFGFATNGKYLAVGPDS